MPSPKPTRRVRRDPDPMGHVWNVRRRIVLNHVVYLLGIQQVASASRVLAALWKRVDVVSNYITKPYIYPPAINQHSPEAPQKREED